MLPLEVYERQRDRMKLRLEAMKRFAFSADECRVRGMLAYFGEGNASDCGKCDVCRARRKRSNSDANATERLEKSILYQAGHPGGSTITSLLENCGTTRDETIAAIRRLADSSLIRIEGNKITLI